MYNIVNALNATELYILLTHVIINKLTYLLTNIFLHDYLCFTDEETEEQRGKMTYPRLMTEVRI